ncbi:MAG: hypothetical protein AB1730_14630 [Myxococcota bacterium]|jgi:hypothetical protein
MRPLLAPGLSLALGCANASGAVATAAVNTAIAAGVAASRRADGECFTPCNPGTVCNPKTGYCDPQPCGGKCRPEEDCAKTSWGERCVPRLELELRGTAPGAAGTPTSEPPVQAAPSAAGTADAGVPDAGARPPPPPPRPSDVPTRLPDAPALERP